MYETIKEYIKAKGFKANPFATTNAEQEKDYLTSCFVRFPWFDWLVGDPSNPESLILFAPQGYGKTSHRMEVARIAGEPSSGPRALIIHFDDISLLLSEETKTGNLAHAYLNFIRRKTLWAIREALMTDPTHLKMFCRATHDLERFCALLRRYEGLYCLPDWGVDDKAVTEVAARYDWLHLGIREWLREELSPLVRSAGFASVYVLFDGLDEADATRGNSEAMLKLISPLLNAPGLLQGCGFAFKFFLPRELEEHMREQKGARLDRIPSRTFEWDFKSLARMLERRLLSFNQAEEKATEANQIRSFADLCERKEALGFDVDARLVETACCSPRRLIDLARRIIELHCERNGALSAETDISAETINDILHHPETPRAAPVVVATPQQPFSSDEPTHSPEGIPLLFLDKRGDIWVGTERRTKRLAPKRRELLTYLWENRGRLVSYEELLEKLYKGDTKPGTRADPWASCDKLARFVRAYLEPDNKGGSHNYVEMRKEGYVLRNYRDSQTGDTSS